jgi:hypothetical protein
MKRLGAGIRDAEEIKEHPFFASIDWASTFKRELKPPKPEPQTIRPLLPADMISYAQIFNNEIIEQ